MPSGKNHDKITFITLPCLTFASFLVTRQPILVLLISSSFLFSGLMFGPDLDIYSIQFKRWGILRNLWLPYQKFFSHRSFFSHGFIVGTVIRVIYLFTFIFLVGISAITITQIIWGFDWNWQEFVISTFTILFIVYWQKTLAVFIGLELGAMSHYLADGIMSWLKRFSRRRSTKKSNNLKSSNRKKRVRKKKKS